MPVALRLFPNSTGMTAVVAWMVALICMQPGTAHAFCRTTTVKETASDPCPTTGKELWWGRRCISFTVVDSGMADMTLERLRDVADKSFRTWTRVDCSNGPVALDVRQTADVGVCVDAEYNPNGPNANVISIASDWSGPELPADAYAITLVWHHPDTGNIYDVDMQINATLGAPTICDGICPRGAFDLQNVITHEAGHFLGLGHSAVGEATMSSRATIGETSKRDLANDDIEGLCAIYGANAPAVCETTDFVPNHGFSTTCGLPGEAVAGTSSCAVAAAGTRQASRAALLFLTPACLPLLRRRRSRTQRRLLPR